MASDYTHLASADALVDRCVKVLHKAMERLEAIPVLEREDVDMVVRICHAAREVMRIQLDPLGAAGRKRLKQLSDLELEDAIEALKTGRLPRADC